MRGRRKKNDFLSGKMKEVFTKLENLTKNIWSIINYRHGVYTPSVIGSIQLFSFPLIERVEGGREGGNEDRI